MHEVSWLATHIAQPKFCMAMTINLQIGSQKSSDCLRNGIYLTLLQRLLSTVLFGVPLTTAVVLMRAFMRAIYSFNSELRA